MDGLHDDHDNGPTSDLESKVLHVQGNVLQTVGGQLIQVNVGDGDAGTVLSTSQEDEESRKRRELLARRPSYRKIFNELSDSGMAASTVPKVEDDADSNDSLMSGDELPNNFSTISAGNISYQIAPGNAVAQGVVMASGGGASEEASRKRELRLLKNSDPSSPQWLSNLESTLGLPTPRRSGVNMDEAARKLELRLLKNREAARECRRKKKEYIKCLENRVALLENQNKTLIEELKSLKELYCQKETQS